MPEVMPDGMTLGITETRMQDAVTLRVIGELDRATAADVVDRVRRALRQRPARMHST
jgi:ABC-type transporter Mla MlaB component